MLLTSELYDTNPTRTAPESTLLNSTTSAAYCRRASNSTRFAEESSNMSKSISCEPQSENNNNNNNKNKNNNNNNNNNNNSSNNNNNNNNSNNNNKF